MEQTTVYLFVYGTLLKQKNEYANYLRAHCVLYGNGYFNGLLYNVGEYPGAIEALNSDDMVHGKIYQMLNVNAVLKVLDSYEGFGEQEQQPNEFIRKLINVNTPGTNLTCWVYLYNLPVNELNRIKSGNYLAVYPDK